MHSKASAASLGLALKTQSSRWCPTQSVSALGVLPCVHKGHKGDYGGPDDYLLCRSVPPVQGQPWQNILTNIHANIHANIPFTHPGSNPRLYWVESYFEMVSELLPADGAWLRPGCGSLDEQVILRGGGGRGARKYKALSL